MPLNDSELAAHDSLAQALVRHLRALLPPTAFEEQPVKDSGEDTVLVVRVPAASSSVGDLLIYSDGAELTTMVGDHTHGHTGAYLFGDATDPSAIDKAASSEAGWVRDMLADQIVVWSRRSRSREVLSGGTETIAPDRSDRIPQWRRNATEAWLWSGRSLPVGHPNASDT